MTDTAPSGRSVLEWGFAGAALEGGRSGDVQVVAPFEGGVLLAVIDGLGHGPEAALAAEVAAAVLKRRPAAAIVDLIALCHEELRRTRGAVLTIASLDARSSTIAWGGVGNVDAVLLRKTPRAGQASDAAPVRGGVVGDRIPPLKIGTTPIAEGDLLVLASDGIRSGFTRSVDHESTPQEIADRIFERHARPSDDSLVLVARYLGGTP